MLEQVVKMAAVGIVGAFAALLVKKSNPEQAMLICLAAAVAIFFLAVPAIDALFVYLDELTDATKLSRDILSPLFKTVGIAIITKLGVDICQEAGAKAAAGGLELAGSVAALVLAMPLFSAVLKMIEGLLT